MDICMFLSLCVFSITIPTGLIFTICLERHLHFFPRAHGWRPLYNIPIDFSLYLCLILSLLIQKTFLFSTILHCRLCSLCLRWPTFCLKWGAIYPWNPCSKFWITLLHVLPQGILDGSISPIVCFFPFIKLFERFNLILMAVNMPEIDTNVWILHFVLNTTDNIIIFPFAGDRSVAFTCFYCSFSFNSNCHHTTGDAVLFA